jgi:hypothetical protein
VKELELKHGSSVFGIDERRKAARSSLYDVYVCSIDGRPNAGLLQISTSADNNPVLNIAATTLQLLKMESERWDEDHHFDWLYPEILASFSYKETGVSDRQVNILAIQSVKDVTELYAIAQIINSGRRVDTRTAIWIFGRMLKLLMFIHPRGYSIGITSGKMLIHPGTEEVLHQAVLFDWTDVKVHGNNTPVSFCQEDIKTSAKTILELLGADYRTGECPYDDEHGFAKYVFGLTKNDGNTPSIYDSYYRYIYDIFGKEFHPFTTFIK